MKIKVLLTVFLVIGFSLPSFARIGSMEQKLIFLRNALPTVLSQHVIPEQRGLQLVKNSIDVESNEVQNFVGDFFVASRKWTRSKEKVAYMTPYTVTFLATDAAGKTYQGTMAMTAFEAPLDQVDLSNGPSIAKSYKSLYEKRDPVFTLALWLTSWRSKEPLELMQLN